MHIVVRMVICVYKYTCIVVYLLYPWIRVCTKYICTYSDIYKYVVCISCVNKDVRTHV